MRIDAKRLAGLSSLLLFMALCASLTYWSMQWLVPKQRAVQPAAAAPQINLSLAAEVFGSASQTMANSGNYQLMGVLAADNDADSVAIVSADGKPARALRVGVDVENGVHISEIHPTYIVLSVGGVDQRVALPEKGRYLATPP